MVINIGSIQRKLLSHLWLETEQQQQQQLARNGVNLTKESNQGADHFVRMRTVHVGLCLCCLQAIKADSLASDPI